MRYFLLGILLFILPVSGVYVVQSDNSSEFANSTASAKCNEEDTQAVYICSGNVVRVVSYAGTSTFYRPGGSVVHCSSPSTSAECFQMLTPNYCQNQVECGNETYVSPPEEEEAVPTEQPTPPPPPPPATATENISNQSQTSPPQPNVTRRTTNDLTAPTPTPSNFEFSLDSLVTVLLVLAVVSVVLLFSLFKKSLVE